MRKIVLAGATTVTGLVLLLSYPTSRHHALDGAATAGGAPGSGLSAGDAPGASSQSPRATSGPSAGPSSGQSAGPSSAGAGTYTGAEVNTQWGVVQVEVTVEHGRVVDAQAVQAPDGNSRDQEINAYAVPILEQETVRAGSSQIDAVSGATVTSEGYIESLQSALDQAGLR
ncbi:FMN-binding protein [Georgenia thermotolerans]|uniref:FMN-binding protein n=1 Tax=Georgenia thermotolerans TaxID=527326 RepID=A0A7J5US11_9MICO|nr:FMN-binding protein [Georgenia thermotolerans]KAE8765149.1 FMN-binding protein [Georgenia thermotolerans]